MKIFHDVAEFPFPGREVFCTIGMFDGVHRGHQHLIDLTLARTRAAKGVSLAITFAPHPARVVAPAQAPNLIYPPRKRNEILASKNLDAIWIIPFDQAFSRLTGQEFLSLICERLAPLRLICVGPDFHFGYRRSGNLALLRSLSDHWQYHVPEITSFMVDGAEVSSTMIRNFIRRGQFADASNCLGRPYTLCGEVIEGDHAGRTIGFPTANLHPANLELPPLGVYAVRAQSPDGLLQGVMNIGYRPTRDSTQARLLAEAHFFEFAGSLYGKSLSIEPIQFIRPERQFPSLEALRQQIEADCRQARELIERPNSIKALETQRLNGFE